MDLSVDLTAMLAIWIAGVLLLVAVAGLAARLGLKPVLDSVARLRAAGRGAPELEERFAGVERQLRAVSGRLDRVAEALERREARL
jgi:hypothetical protein